MLARMNTPRFRGFLVLLLASAFKLAAQPQPAAPAVPDLLFVQSVQAGAFAAGRLTIENNQAPVLFFMERPGRVTGQLTARRFLDFWGEGADSFQADPPNAVLAIAAGDTVTSVVVELTGAAATPHGMSYAVKVLSGTLPEHFGPASLFIDSFPSSRLQPRPHMAVRGARTFYRATAQVMRSAPPPPAQRRSALYVATSQALGNAAHNATTTQQNANTILQATTTQGVALLYGVDTSSTAVGIDEILGKQ
jgi:hypothetical protein